jgi:subtilisin family serine protease
MNKILTMVVTFLVAYTTFAQNIHPHQIVVKLHNAQQMPKFLDKITQKSIERAFPNHQAPSPKEKSRSGLPLVDLSRIYYVSLREGVSVQEAIRLLKTDKNVEYACPLRIAQPLFVPNDPGAIANSDAVNDFNQYYLAKIKAYEAWDIQQSNPSTVIGIIDYGFRTTHEDLVGNLHPDYIDLGNNDFNLNLPHPFSYHGGAVAGVAAATPNNGIGIAGVGYNSRYLPVKVISDAFNIFRFDAAVIYLADRNVKVINMSFGYEGEPDEYWEDIVNYAFINKDVVMVAAAGNNGNTGRFWPASYKNVISVTGTTANDIRWAGSNYNYEVDITAPSEFIRTTYYNCCAYGGIYNNDNSYIEAVSMNMSGTSFAAPQVAGVVALVRTQFPELDARQAMERVIATSDNIDALNPSVAGLIGRGRLNAFRAVSESNLKAIRSENHRFINNSYPLAATSASLVMDFKNILSPTTNLSVTLTSLSPFVTVTTNNITLGAMVSNEVKSNESAPFTIQIAANTPFNTEVVFKLDYQDGTHTSYEYVKIVVNPDYAHIDLNLLTLNVGRTGRIADYAYPYKKGVGYLNVGNYSTVGYAGGLMISTHLDSVVNSVTDYLGNFNTEFDTLAGNSFSYFKNSDYQEINAFFRDIGNKRPKLRIHKKAYAFADAPNQKFVIVEYDVTNDSTRVIPQLNVGLFTDFDLLTYTQNRANWNNALRLGYVYHSSGNLYAGIKLLTTQSPHYYAFNNNGSGGSINLYDGFTKAEKHTAIANGIARPQAGMSGLGTDVSIALGGAITNIAPNETRKIAYAYVVGNSLTELQNNAQAAQDKFVEVNTTPLPDIAGNFTVCYGDSLRLTPSNGNSFDFYDSFPLTTPIYSGNSLLLTNLTTSSTIYIVGKDRLFPSSPKTVNITVAPLHEAVIIATPYAGLEWLFEDYSTDAHTSVWDFGDGSVGMGRLIRHTFPHAQNYTVKLISSNTLGCVDSTSKTISVIASLNEDLKNVSVYPNPTENKVFLKGIEGFEWQLKNVWGNVVLRGKENELDLKGLPSGVYCLQIQTLSGDTKIVKIVKK